MATTSSSCAKRSAGRGFGRLPARADAEDEAAAAEYLQRRGHLGGESGWAVTVPEDVVAQLDPLVTGGEPAQRGPRLHERVGAGVHAVEVVGEPDPIEVLDHRGQDVPVLVHDDGLVAAPPVPDRR